MEDVKDAVDRVMSAFEQFKIANDENLKKQDALLEVKLNKITAELNRFEDLNQKISAEQAASKAMQEQMDRVEAILNRSNAGQDKLVVGREAMDLFDRLMRKPAHDRKPEDLSNYRKYVDALIKADDTSAGYLLAPPDMQAEIIKNLIEITPMRAYATVRTIGSGSLKQPKKTGNGSATRVGETTPRSNTGDPAYGLNEWQAPELFARIEVSQQMLEDTDYDLMAELREDMTDQFAVKEGVEYISGSGNGQCEGILTNSEIGYETSGSAAAVTADGLIKLYYGLKTSYARNGVWGMNRKTLSAVRRLKDDNNQYLWVPGIANGVANTILGAPYAEFPDMPDEAANAFPVVFADFRRGYVIVDRIAISVQADYVTGADDGLVVFRGRKRTGGGVRQPEAIRKLKCST